VVALALGASKLVDFIATATAHSSMRYPVAAMFTVCDTLDAFLQEHRRCGKMDSGIEGERVWATCTCGAQIILLFGPVGERLTDTDPPERAGDDKVTPKP
jgi:hypothetical protein